MTERTLGLIIAWVAEVFVAIASEFFPIVGVLAVPLVFPQGIHSDHATVYLFLAMFLNFAILFAITFGIARYAMRKRQNSN